eukprot:5212965-Amphidinium_carterae.1
MLEYTWLPSENRHWLSAHIVCCLLPADTSLLCNGGKGPSSLCIGRYHRGNCSRGAILHSRSKQVRQSNRHRYTSSCNTPAVAPQTELRPFRCHT